MKQQRVLHHPGHTWVLQVITAMALIELSFYSAAHDRLGLSRGLRVSVLRANGRERIEEERREGETLETVPARHHRSVEDNRDCASPVRVES